MAEAVPYIEEQKRAQLEALARGGSAALAEHQAAQAAVQQAQTAALDAEMGRARYLRAGSGAETELASIIQRGAAPRLAEMAARQGADQSRMEGLSAANASYMDALTAQVPAIEAELAASRGGGGGGGGGKSGTEDWWKALEDEYDTKSDLYNWIEMTPGEGRTPAYLKQRELALSMGVPEAVADVRFQPSDYLSAGMARAQRMASRGVPVRQFRRKATRAARAENLAGDLPRPNPERRYLVDQYRQMVAGQPRQARRKGNR